MTRRIAAWTLCALGFFSISIWYPHTSELDDPLKGKGGPATPSKHAGGSSDGTVDFRRDILPILSSKCFVCHGADDKGRKGKLRLDQREAAILPARSGKQPIVPGKSAESELVERIFTDDDEERMPPVKTGKSLSEQEKNLLKRWIDQGAEYQLHWAFVKPVRPAIPTVKDKSWVKNEIDAFILAKLEAAGIAPSPRADRSTLIRRLSLDLRGIPPTLQEIDAFLDDDSSNAYEKLVDRMLASPRHGEKLAMLWLDLARFGDTSGYHEDSYRQMWLWRDWVISAFNDDMPFDQFTILQLAGDLVPGAGDKGKIASGFNRNTRFNEEGGVDPEEYVIRYNVDRTNTLGQVWLGLTLGCAECHSHKYDPITHKEYYQLFAYFSGIKEPMIEGTAAHGRPLPPLLKVPSLEQTRKLAEHRAELVKLEATIRDQLKPENFPYKDPFEGKVVPEIVPLEMYLQSQRAWETRARDDRLMGGTFLPDEVYDTLAIDSAKRTDAQQKLIREFYLRKVNSAGREHVEPFEREIVTRTKEMQTIEATIPYTLISEEMAEPRPTYVLERGIFGRKEGKPLSRDVPAILPPMPKDAPPNRLGLARWLVSPDHPLTARVTVNRLWAQMFGAGIVRTIGDFGTQGDYPSHPELLDWLACDFSSPLPSGGEGARGRPQPWSVKRLLRTIALSATYQQSSVYRRTVTRIDPQNRLLSFTPRYRLSAEEVRDSVLAISGLLSSKIGGQSFMPYQPADFYRFKNEGWFWRASDGEEQYRRGMYSFWRRTALHPMFVTFDAPTREDCVVSRPRTNTPLQALVTLNDPTFVEAARVFAQQLLRRGPKDNDARLALAFRTATCRSPTPAELNVLRSRYRQQHERFSADKEGAERFVNAGQYPRDAGLDVPELAAWTSVCNMVLNLDEILTRE